MDQKKLNIKDLESFIITWNLRFKYDRIWRKKYNIPFGSKEHLEANQINIFLDCLEDRLFEKARAEQIEKLKALEEYRKTGSFLKEKVYSEAQIDKLLKNVKL